MVSRRYFFGMTAIMAILFFMFMFSEIVKSSDAGYSRNNYINNTSITHSDDITKADALKISYLGEDEIIRTMVTQWCEYTDRELVSEVGMNVSDNDIMIVDGKALTRSKVETVKKAAENGVVIIFCGFPDIDLISDNASLRILMGVNKIEAKSVETKGFYLYSGFLLGGEAVYTAETERAGRYQDFNLTLPWIVTGKGTKTYMSGILMTDEKEMLTNSPALIWRANANDTTTFVVYDDFVKDSSLMGILEACVYESSDFDLYPVVNANMYSIADFALLSNENADTVQQIYSRSTKSLTKEILWPRLQSFVKRENIHFTFYFNSGLEENCSTTSGEDLNFFLRELRDVSSEAGISANVRGGNVGNKLGSDIKFYDQTVPEYTFAGVFAKDYDDSVVKAVNAAGSDLKYITFKNIIGRVDLKQEENCTVMGTTQDVAFYSFKNDFLMRSINTALGYSNVLLNMDRVYYPESAADEWQIYSDQISENLSDYWTKLNVFDQVTISEGGSRVANYLGFKATASREYNLVTIKTNGSGTVLLRTHGEKITYVEGAKARIIEEDVYLIEIDSSDTVKLTLEVR